MTPMDWATVMHALSVAGMLLLVIAFILNQRGKLLATSKTYLLMNGVGSLFLTVYSIYIWQWVFAVLEGFWCFVSFQPLTRRPAAKV